MRRINPSRVGGAAAWAAALFLIGAGADKKPLDLKNEPIPKADEIVEDIAFVRANDDTKVEGVGLVVGLNNTGSNPAPSTYRTDLLNTMRKATVPNAEMWLESPHTALVLVRATIPQGITTRDRFDIEIVSPPGSTTTSLAGGHLLMTELRVKQFVDGQFREGQVMGEAYGPIMTGSVEAPDEPRIGRILGGARVFKDSYYLLILKDGRKGIRVADMLQRTINFRFYERKGVEMKGMATAKNDQVLVLNVPRVYHHNQYRYFQVISQLPMVDSEALRARRMQQWTEELLDPKTSGKAALRLEGVGRNAIAALKLGLGSDHEQVRFFAAEALAYLNDSDGVDVLASAAVEHPEFRAHALAALAAMDQPASILRLRKLMDQPDPDIRYGAFNALRTIDEHDPFLGRVRLLRDEKVESDEDDPQAIRLPSVAARRATRAEDPFELFVVECDGPPLVHVARTRRREVVIFGRDQGLLTPVAIGGSGSILLNATLADDRVQISRFALSHPDLPDMKVSSPLELGAVIREVANLGATYPEVVSLLQTAHRQQNLAGALVIDAVPAPRPDYEAAQLAGVDATADSDVQPAGFEAESAERPKRRTPILERLRRRFDR